MAVCVCVCVCVCVFLAYRGSVAHGWTAEVAMCVCGYLCVCVHTCICACVRTSLCTLQIQRYSGGLSGTWSGSSCLEQESACSSLQLQLQLRSLCVCVDFCVYVHIHLYVHVCVLHCAHCRSKGNLGGLSGTWSRTSCLEQESPWRLGSLLSVWKWLWFELCWFANDAVWH